MANQGWNVFVICWILNIGLIGREKRVALWQPVYILNAMCMYVSCNQIPFKNESTVFFNFKYFSSESDGKFFKLFLKLSTTLDSTTRLLESTRYSMDSSIPFTRFVSCYTSAILPIEGSKTASIVIS